MATASNNANIPPDITEVSTDELFEIFRFLVTPDSSIGSIKKHTQTLWVYENYRMIRRSVTYVPGLYKIFDEILVNAADNKPRSVKVTIDVESNSISVFYNNGDGDGDGDGDGIPVVDYILELVGRAKLTNIWSDEFVVETADSKKKYKQVFSRNMRTKTKPNISECGENDNWTKITFKPDLANFKMDCLEDDVVALMKKRVIDIAGCLPGKVELNGQNFQFNSFSDYCQFYYMAGSSSEQFVEDVHDRWQICIRPSDGEFQQVSFVNYVATIQGGTHVDYLTNKVVSHLVSVINKKNKGIDFKPHSVKNHLWVFVNALIDEPSFDSPTKETLILDAESFGSSWDFTPNFLDKVAKSDIMNNIEESASKYKNVPEESDQRTLILSAKSQALTPGHSVFWNGLCEVVALEGRFPNVRDEGEGDIWEDENVAKIVETLGLNKKETYDDPESMKYLKYNHVMIMTNQDPDGFHFKGLLLNLFHTFWPALLKAPSFLQAFINPIVKAIHTEGREEVYFYTMPQYKAWKESLGSAAVDWTINYYKGLGTCSYEEVKEYFRDLENHTRDFLWENDGDGDAIELAFSGKKIEARKNWLRQFKPGTFLDHTKKQIKYSDFVNHELVYYFIADHQSSIPSIVDGLKPEQRKILFYLFKSKSVAEIEVEQLCAEVNNFLACDHGCLASTIIGMAQDYVGSNNISLLLPNCGFFGNRYKGGKDHGIPTNLYTQLSPMTRLLFREEDDIFLTHLNEVGKSVEPIWYAAPIIPMVLVNESEGIGSVLSSSVPNYNPLKIIANIKKLLKGEPIEAMDPWYRGFSGFIEKSTTEDAGASYYTSSGRIEKVDEKTFWITELPIPMRIKDYEKFLWSVSAGNDKSKDPFVQDFHNLSLGDVVHFSVCMSEKGLSDLKEEGLLEKLKLTTSVRASNMHLFDSTGAIEKYETPEQILKEFYYVRLEMYKTRKNAMLANLVKEKLKCENKCRFIEYVCDNKIILNGKNRTDLFHELKALNFDPFPEKENISEVAVAGLTNEDKESVENSSDYDYLLSLPTQTLTLKELFDERVKREKEVEDLKQATVESLWMKDLDDFERKFSEELNNYEKEMEIVRNFRRGRLKKNSQKKNQQTSKKASVEELLEVSENTTTETEEVGEIKKLRGKAAAQKKAPAAEVTATTDEDDDNIADLRHRKRKRQMQITEKSPDNKVRKMRGSPFNKKSGKKWCDACCRSLD